MRTLLVFTFITLLIVPFVSAQCIEPLDARAFEVVLNCGHVLVNPSKLQACTQVAHISEYVFAYKSGYDKRFAVIISLQELRGSNYRYPCIRIQFLNESLAGVSREDLRRVLDMELDRLCSEGILIGLNESLKAKILTYADFGLAGWDRRLVWDNGDFKPFNESSLYYPPRGCLVPQISDYSTLPTWSGSQEATALLLILLLLTGLLLLVGVYTLRRKNLSRKASSISGGK
ncbi:MAG: hypothetical protein ABWK01_09825 [Infirmifilum sp.]